MDIEFLQGLKFSWTAKVLLKNNKETTIWFPSLPMIKSEIQKVLSVSSDYPKFQICDSESYKFLKECKC